MSPAPDKGTNERVIVAIDDVSAAQAAVDAAVRLASAIDATLTALFLENADLLRAAALPDFMETGRMSGIARPIPGAAIARMFRQRAEQVRTAVATAAEATGLEWRFEVVHGRRSALLAAPRDALDFLVLPQAAAEPVPGVSPRRRAARETADKRPIAVAVRDVPSVGRALRAAQALAGACDAPLLIILCAGGGPPSRRLREFARRALGATPRRAEYVTLGEAGDAAVAAAARQHDARLLVCCDGDLRHDAQRLDTLLARVRCPVVVAD